MRKGRIAALAIISALACLSHRAHAQPHNSFGPMGGIHCGYWTRVEAGVTYAKDAGAHYKWGYGGWKLTGVVEASHARSVGVEVGYWADALLAFGMNMGYYSDFTHSEIVLRPEIGLGAMGVRLVYGYNLLPTLRGVGRHELSLIGYLPVIDLGVASGGY